MVVFFSFVRYWRGRSWENNIRSLAVLPEKAIDELKKAVSLSGRSSLYVSSLAQAYAIAGRRSEAEMLLHQTNERNTLMFHLSTLRSSTPD